MQKRFFAEDQKQSSETVNNESVETEVKAADWNLAIQERGNITLIAAVYRFDSQSTNWSFITPPSLNAKKY